MVDIKTFKIDGNNRIVVNGIKIMWTTPSELDSIGSNDMTYEQRFRYLVDCRSKGVTPCKIDKNIHDAKTHFAVSHEHIETYRLTFGDTLEALEEYITETVNTLYEKYKNYMCADEEDIRQEILIIVMQLYKEFVGTNNEVRSTNLKSFKYFINRKIEHNICIILKGYMQTSFGHSKTDRLIELNKLSQNDCISIDVETVADKFNVNYSEAKNMIKFCDYVMRHEDIHDSKYVNILNDDTDIEKSVINDIVKNNLLNYIRNKLTNREFFIIVKRFGLDGTEPATLEKMGKILRVNVDRVRMIENRALRKLRSMDLIHYLDMDNYK